MKYKFLTIWSFCVIFICTLEAYPQRSIFPKFPEPTELEKKVNKKLSSGDVAGALAVLDKAIEKKEDLFQAYTERSRVRRFYTDDMGGAISDLDIAIAMKPDDVELYTARAYAKKRSKNFAGALQDYASAQKLTPQSLELFKLKGETYAILGRYDDAIAETRSALKISPENIWLHTELSGWYARKNDADRAISLLQGFLDSYSAKRNGKMPKVKGEKIKKKQIKSEFGGSQIGNVKRYSQMEFTATSAADLQKQQDAVEEARSLSLAFIQLGRLYAGKNDLEKAFINLDKALSIDANQEEAYGLKGVLHLSKRENEKAILELTNAIEISDVPYFYLNRGMAYLSSNNAKKAQSDFDAFLKLYPNGKAMLDQRIAELKSNKSPMQESPK